MENKIARFSSYIVNGSKNFDICYIAKLFVPGWTSIGYNGEDIGLTISNNTRIVYDISDDIFISNLITYLKQKNEAVPHVNNHPKLIPFHVTKNS